MPGPPEVQAGGKAVVVRKELTRVRAGLTLKTAARPPVWRLLLRPVTNRTSCWTLEALLEALEATLKTVQCQIVINEHVVASKKSKKLGGMEVGSYWQFVAGWEITSCPLPFCKFLAGVERWESGLGGLRAALARRTPPSISALRGSLRTQERELNVEGLVRNAAAGEASIGKG